MKTDFFVVVQLLSSVQSVWYRVTMTTYVCRVQSYQNVWFLYSPSNGVVNSTKDDCVC